MRALCLVPVLFALLVASPGGRADESAPIAGTELQSILSLYEDAMRQEAEALAAFREIRAMQASRSLQITLDDARQRLQIPAPDRPDLDLSSLQLSRPDPARVAEQRQALRDVTARVEEILTYVRELHEQIQEATEAAEAEELTLDTLRAELAEREQSEILAAEDEFETSKDMTGLAADDEPDPAASAWVDAMIAQGAADQAEEMARDSRENKDPVADQATAAANEARSAADDAVNAAHEARTASSQSRPQDATTAAARAATASANAVSAAARVARLTGNMTFLTATRDHQARAAASHQKTPALTSDKLGGFHPGATRFQPGRAMASRRISATGRGIEWIYLDSWYVLGPFPNPNRRNVDTSYPPESIIDLDATYTGDGAPIRWRFTQSSSPYVLPDNPREYSIYYAYTELWSDTDVDLWVMVGADDSSRIWLNGQQIWKSSYTLKPWRLDEGLRKVSFRRGINRILCRFENGWGITGFSMAISLMSDPAR